MKRVALYVRVSTDEQKKHGISVENQIVALTKYAKEHDYIVVGTYNDAGISARKKYTKRPALLRLLDDCKQGKIDLILFTRIDRWFRNVSAYYQVQDILDKYRVPWMAIWEDYETETSAGVLRVNLMLSIAQAEADRDRERTKSVLDYKKSKGEFVGKRPKGYNILKSHLVINEEEKEGLNAFFRTFLATFSPSDAICAASDHGLKLTAKAARYILQNEIYTGSCGEIKCDPYITREEYEKIMLHVDGKKFRKQKNPERIYLFSGLCYCGECGKAMTPIRKKSNGREYLAYRCYTRYQSGNCENKSYSEISLEKYLLNELDKIIAGNQVLEYEVTEQKKKDEKRIEKLNSKLRRIGDRYEDGDITKEEYQSKRTAVLAEIASIKSAMPKSSLFTKLPDNWKDIYADLTKENKRAFWHMTLTRIELKRGCDPVVY